jgi:hypothetical protein
MADVLVRIQTNHECLGQLAPVMSDYESAVKWIELVMGKIEPVEWLNFVAKATPYAVSPAREILKLCFGYDA